MIRHTRSNPCPVCGGHDGLPRGQGLRCHGFTDDRGEYAHCSREEFAGELESEANSSTYAHWLAGPCRCGNTHQRGTPAAQATLGRSAQHEIEATYDYTDELGKLLFQVVRCRPKSFWQRRADGHGGWISRIDGVRRVPYRFAELLAGIAAGDTVYIVEGEKDADALHAAGCVATCNPGGAGKWRPAFAQYFNGADAVVVADKDPAGRTHARQVADSLQGAAKGVRIVEAKAGKDAFDHLEAGFGVDDFVDVQEPEPEPAEAHALHDTSEEPADQGCLLAFPHSAFRGTFAAVVDLLRPVTGASPAHIFAATWAAMASCIGPARWGYWSGRVVTPVYALCIGPTGDHKTTAMDLVAELLPDSVRHIDGVTTDAGLFEALIDARGAPVLFHFDELGFLLKTAGIRNQALDSYLNRLWGAPRKLDRNLSSRNGGPGARSVDRPLVSFIAGTQVQTFWRHLQDPELAIGAGFVNRLVPFVVERSNRSLPVTRAPDVDASARVRGELARLATLDEHEVTLSGQASELWAGFSSEHDRRVGDLSYPRSALEKRLRDHVARLALVFATDARRLVIEPADLLLAMEVGKFISASYGRLLLGWMPERGPERAIAIEERLLRYMQRRPPGREWSKHELLQAWNGTSRPSSEELSRVLRSIDGVEEVPQGGRRTKYRLIPASPQSTRKARPELGESVDRGPSAGEVG